MKNQYKRRPSESSAAEKPLPQAILVVVLKEKEKRTWQV
jgi:hypothetical protein